MATIKYSIEDLNNNSTSLLTEYNSMNEALNNLNNLANSIGEHWKGTDSTVYIASLASSVSTLNTYLTKFQTIANNLRTAASCYQAHEDEYKKSLW